MEVSEETLSQWVSSLARDNYAPAGKVYNEIRTMLKMHGTGRPPNPARDDVRADVGDIIGWNDHDGLNVAMITGSLFSPIHYLKQNGIKPIVLMRAAEVKRRMEETRG